MGSGGWKDWLTSAVPYLTLGSCVLAIGMFMHRVASKPSKPLDLPGLEGAALEEHYQVGQDVFRTFHIRQDSDNDVAPGRHTLAEYRAAMDRARNAKRNLTLVDWCTGQESILCPAERVVALSPTGTVLYSSKDDTLALTSAEGKVHALPHTWTHWPTAYFSADGRYLAVSEYCEDPSQKPAGPSNPLQVVRVYDTTTLHELLSEICRDSGSWQQHRLPLCIGDADKTECRVFDADEVREKVIGSVGIKCRAPCLAGNDVLLHGFNQVVSIDITSGKTVIKPAAYDNLVIASKPSPSGNYVAVITGTGLQGSGERRLFVFNTATLEQTVLSDKTCGLSCAWHPTEDVLAYQPIPPLHQGSSYTRWKMEYDVFVFDPKTKARRPAVDNPEGLDLLMGWHESGLAIYSDRQSDYALVGDLWRSDGAGNLESRLATVSDVYADQLWTQLWPRYAIGFAALVLTLPFASRLLRRRRTDACPRLHADGSRHIFDVLVEHPVVSGIAFSAAAGITLAKRAQLGSFIGYDLFDGVRGWSKTALTAAAYSIGAAIATVSAFPFYLRFNNIPPRRVWPSGVLGRTLRILTVGPSEKDVRHYYDQLRFEDSFAMRTKAALLLSKGDYDGAAMSYREAYARPDLTVLRMESPFSPLVGMFGLISLPQYLYALRNGTVQQAVSLQLSFMNIQLPGRARRLHEVIARNPLYAGSPELMLLEGIILQMAGDKTVAAKCIEDAVVLAIKEGRSSERLGDYQVYRLGGGEFMKSTVILKASKERRWLEQEAELTGKAARILAPHVSSSTVLCDPCFVQGVHVLPLRYEAGTILSSSDDIGIYEKAAYALGLLHGHLALVGGNQDESHLRSDRRQRLLDVCADDTGLEQAEDLASDASNRYQSVLKKDPHGENWIVTPSNLVAIDFEPRGGTQPPHELSKLLWQRPLWKKEVLDALMAMTTNAYIRARQKTPHPLSDDEQKSLQDAIVHVTPLRAISFAGAMMGRPARRGTVCGFIDNALEATRHWALKDAAAEEYLVRLRSSIA